MKVHMPYGQAKDLADQFINEICGCCARIQVAGSLRRKADFVGDIEILCIPTIKQYQGLLGPEPYNMLEGLFEASHYFLLINGERYKKINLGPIYLDLFITTPEKWGVMLALRTGSADFSKWLVTARQQGGALPSFMKEKDGRLWAGTVPFETPEETAVFQVIGQPFIQPTQRGEGLWKK